MSAMANTTPLVTNVTKPATNPRDTDATPRVNIQEFCKEYYVEILPIIMDKVRRNRRKDVHARLDFGEGPRERTREDSHHSSHRRQSAFDRLSKTYSPSITKSRPRRTDSRDRPRGKNYPHRLDTSNEDCTKDKECFRSVGESYDDSFSHSYRDGSRSRHMKRRKDNESPLSSVSKSDSSEERYQKSRSKRHKSMDEDVLTRPWMCEEEDPFTPRIREAVAASKKKGHTSWKAHDQSKRQTSDKRSDFRGHSREGKGSNRFTPLTRMPKEILVAEAGKFQPPPPMVTPVEKRSSNKFCYFHNDKGHSTDECMQLKKQIEELKKSDSNFERMKEITFPPLTASSGTEGPLVIEVEMGGHMIHRMYVDGGSLMEILYEHCFNRLRPEIKNQMVSATTSLTGFSDKTIWPLGQLRLLVIIGYADHSTRAWMNFMIVRSLSPYNGIIGRPEIREIQAVPSTAHGMLKFPVEGGIVTIRIAKHQLNIREGYSPVRQKKRGQALNVLRPYKQSWRMCVDFTNLNKACPQDWYPLPEIDWKVESLCGYPFKCFLDTYKGYHQIQLAEPDEEKTTFHTRQGVYCYTKMPFGLKNADATYRRLMDKAFNSQIGQNIEVYVDDLVVKSYTEAEMIRDIDETFRTLRKINMKLNPKKSKRLRRYFQEHPITVITNQPIKQIMSHPDVAGRLQKWSVMLGEHNITYRPKTSVKGQILADFITEMPDENPQAVLVAETQQEPWTLFTDRSSCVDGSGAGLILISLEGIEFTYALRFQFVASNNEADYEALIAVLRIAARSFLTPWLRCVGPLQVEYVIREIHEGSWSMHARPRSVVAKAIRLGYYWPTMHQDARDMIRKCNDCQIHLPIIRNPQQPLTPITASWLFYKYGIDIAGPFPEGPGKVKFLIVALDYFMKWIEAKAVATITGSQSNGLVKRANRSLGEGIKARLGEGNKNWVEELPHVLWAHRTMIKSSHGDTPFSIAYGTEAVIPVKIGMPTYRTVAVDVVYNDEELRLNLDMLEERDFVYCSNDASHAVVGGKLGPKWEGPYKVTEALGDGAYKLRSMDRTILLRT
uniref:Reverse transcriptase domain-containing protein n=1 Tax=Tanacetum cinerariifolium TaxID=118510 RepID=A0A6L2LUZ6_TANCI|nr:reverse transcriptase domain-containing protein [Tanacetum cinerariifolium]GEV08656.1 reverse transcriptase domain-containing protein [Tanacetum cinerariifolium]